VALLTNDRDDMLDFSTNPVLLAPLAGVSDIPFRRVCTKYGADLTYVEMLSATALLFESERTYQMMRRHKTEEPLLGVQVTGKSADETARAVAVLDKLSYETIDINMGCPVRKVVSAGCGSAILKDPERVHETVRLAVQATSKPLSVKIRLGWDKSTLTGLEVADAAASAGAAWITVHGRLRSDDYSVPVDLEKVAAIKRRVGVPVVGNGNIFGGRDADFFRRATGVDGVMVSRGALGNPWIFREIKTGQTSVTLDEWRDTVLDHLRWQVEEYGDRSFAAVCMRKHLLWYVKGWPHARRCREEIAQLPSLADASALVCRFADQLAAAGCFERAPVGPDGEPARFLWDPKFDMDRALDRGVGDDCMSAEALT
jgi:tRNA-dihydrouridine synthase B